MTVGGAAFSAGDQVITRINDRVGGIYNRERWEIAQVDAERGRIVLEGINQARRVEVGRDYLDRTTLGGEAPALHHAYAVTTYCAQGTTVDRAYVMADPSMDKQEMYVATSRTREQTHLYATPEIQGERGEYAPTGPERDPIAHVGEAVERDRAQTAAHDEALRAELAKLPTVELAARRDKLDTPARFEARHQEDYARQEQAVEERRAQVEQASATAKQSKPSAGASAARSCPTPRKASSYLPNGWQRRGRSWQRWSRRARRSGASARSPAGFLTPAQRKRSRPPGSSRPLTSSRSWGRGPPIRSRPALGITAFRESSVTGSNTELETRATPLAASRKTP